MHFTKYSEIIPINDLLEHSLLINTQTSDMQILTKEESGAISDLIGLPININISQGTTSLLHQTCSLE